MEYFKHDINASEDDKICELLAAGGYEMLGYYWRFIEYLYSRNGKVSKSKIAGVAWSLHMDVDKLKILVSEFDLFTEDENYIYSKRVLAEVEEFAENGRKLSEAGRRGGKASAKSRAEAKKEATLEAGLEATLEASVDNGLTEAQAEAQQNKIEKIEKIDKKKHNNDYDVVDFFYCVLDLLGENKRKPSKQELAIVEGWQTELKASREMIWEAGVRSRDNTGDIIFKYMDSCIRNWNAKGLRTSQEINARENRKRGNAPSYDINEIEEFNVFTDWDGDESPPKIKENIQ